LTEPEPTVVVGRITRPHGVRGELAVHVLSEVPERFEDGATLSLEDGRTLTVRSARPQKDRLLVTFEEVADRDDAESLRGALLVVPASSSPELPPGSWWDHEILGCVVTTENGRELGPVREVIHTAANDVWSSVAEDGTESLVPVLADVLVDVDVVARRIVVREVPGLTIPDR
jgi:16S rRNA processing protein RimM